MVKKSISKEKLALFNSNLRYESPDEIIRFAVQFSNKPVVTTSFGAHSAAILRATTEVKKDIQVIWCDTGYNTKETYDHADRLIESLRLNVDIFRPNRSSHFFDLALNDESLRAEFSEIVKLEPFRRAMKKHKPDVWFTTVRKNQSAYRDSLDILSFTKEGVLKVSPFYHYSDDQMRAYLTKHKLPVEYNYFDPVKTLNQSECGIQFLS